MLTLDLFAIANRPIVRSSLEVKPGSLKVTGDSYRPFSSSNQQLQSGEAISYLWQNEKKKHATEKPGA